MAKRCAARDPTAIQAAADALPVGAPQRHHRRGHGRPATGRGAHRDFVAATSSTARRRADGHRLLVLTAATLRTVAHTYARARASIIFWAWASRSRSTGPTMRRPPHRAGAGDGTGRASRHRAPSAARGQNNVQGASDAGLVPMFYPDYQPVDQDEVPAVLRAAPGAASDREGGLTVVEIMNVAPMMASSAEWHGHGENPAMSDPDVQHVREALARSIISWCRRSPAEAAETQGYADVVLPASAWPKNWHRHQHQPAGAVGPRRAPHAGRGARGIGGSSRISRGASDLTGATRIRRTCSPDEAAMPSLDNITWTARARKLGDLSARLTEPVGDGFPTPSGRGKLVPVRCAPGEEPTRMVLSTGRQFLEHWHTAR